MAFITIRVVTPHKIQVPSFTARDLSQIGGQAIGLLKQRVRQSRGTDDLPLKSYSPRGPIYVPVYGKAGGGTGTARRGAFGFTYSDMSKMRLSTPRGRRTVKFANYAAMKRAMGRSGNRDLELSGAMLDSVKITAQTADSVTVGFTKEEQHQKGRGNQRLAPWFGLSPRDRKSLQEFAQRLLNLKIRAA